MVQKVPVKPSVRSFDKLFGWCVSFKCFSSFLLGFSLLFYLKKIKNKFYLPNIEYVCVLACEVWKGGNTRILFVDIFIF